MVVPLSVAVYLSYPLKTEKKELRKIFKDDLKNWFGMERYVGKDHEVEAYVEQALFAIEMMHHGAPGMNETLRRWEANDISTPFALLRSWSWGKTTGIPVRWLVHGWSDDKKHRR